MGAFLLYKSGCEIDAASTRSVFEKKGFDAPRVFQLGAWTLWLYRKQLIETDNFVKDDATGNMAFSVGTPIYRGKSYMGSLKSLLVDFAADSLDQTRLIGSCCVLFWDGRQVKCLTDRQNTLHVFYDERREVVSSSFLSLVAASKTPRNLNRLALCEKLSTGYIVSPDTLVEGVSQIDDAGMRDWPSGTGVDWICHPGRAIGEGCLTFKDGICRQHEVLKRHFLACDAISQEFGGELGLSDGFDSRLVLACAKYFSSPIGVHTHATKGSHDESKLLVEAMAKIAGVTVKEVPTSRMEELSPGRIAEVMEDGLYYYDGRCSHNMGAFSETYTRWYRRQIIDSRLFSLNGLGGELYRNYYETSTCPVDLEDWLDSRVYYYFAGDAVESEEIFRAMRQHTRDKLIARVGETMRNGKVDFLWRRDYYSSVRMPDCDANNNDAHQQLQFFHTPFMDEDIVAEGLRATPFIGVGTTFQAALITDISRAIAACQSHYGYPFTHVPFKPLLKAWVRGHIPDALLYKRNKAKTRRDCATTAERFVKLTDCVPALAAIRTALFDFKAVRSFDTAMIEYAQRPTTFSVGKFLQAFGGKVR